MAFLSKIDVPRGAFIVVVIGRGWPHVELLSGFIGPEVSPLDTALVQFGNQFPKWVIHLERFYDTACVINMLGEGKGNQFTESRDAGSNFSLQRRWHKPNLGISIIMSFVTCSQVMVIWPYHLS